MAKAKSKGFDYAAAAVALTAKDGRGCMCCAEPFAGWIREAMESWASGEIPVQFSWRLLDRIVRKRAKDEGVAESKLWRSATSLTNHGRNHEADLVRRVEAGS